MIDVSRKTIRQKIVDDFIRIMREWSDISDVRYGEPGVKLEWQKLPCVWVWDDFEDGGESADDTMADAGSTQIEFGRFNVNVMLLFEFKDDKNPDNDNNINILGNAYRGQIQHELMQDSTRGGIAFNTIPQAKDIRRTTYEGLAILWTTWTVQYHSNIKEPWSGGIY